MFQSYQFGMLIAVYELCVVIEYSKFTALRRFAILIFGAQVPSIIGWLTR